MWEHCGVKGLQGTGFGITRHSMLLFSDLIQGLVPVQRIADCPLLQVSLGGGGAILRALEDLGLQFQCRERKSHPHLKP